MTAYTDHEKSPRFPRCGTTREPKFFDTNVSTFAFLNMTFNHNLIGMTVESEVVFRTRLILGG